MDARPRTHENGSGAIQVVADGPDPAGVATSEAPARHSPRSGRLWRQAPSWALGVALLAFIAARADLGRLLPALAQVPWWRWALAALGLSASYLFRAGRIHAELGRRWGASRRRCLEVMLLHNAAVNVVPMRGGDLAYPYLVHQRLGVPIADGVGSLVWMRCQDALVLALLATAIWPGIPPAIRWAGAASIAAAMAGLVRILPWTAVRLAGVAERRRLLGILRAALVAVAQATEHGPAGWACCAASWSTKLVAVGSLLAPLAGLSALGAVSGALGGEIAGALPLQGPAGFGTYEVAVWAGASLGGPATLQVALAAAAVHVFALAVALCGGLVGLAPRLLQRDCERAAR